MTLSNWKTHITAKGIDPNEAMRLLQDAQAQMDALRAALLDLLGAIFEASDMAHIEDLLNYIEEAEDNARRVLEEVTL